MEVYNFMQNTNQAISKNMKHGVLKDSNKNQTNLKSNNNIKLSQSNSQAKLLTSEAQPNLILKDCKELKYSSEEFEKDVSMLSIHDESQNIQYYLPSAFDMKNYSTVKKFSDGVIARRILNREETQNHINEYGQDILKLSYDDDTGDIMVLEILDYMQELECRSSPLGLNFLEGTNVLPNKRNEAINWLYNLAYQFGVERYSVHNGMAIADRYVKAKGSSFKYSEYSYIILSSWYIACKWDLIMFPSLKEVCALSEIENIKYIHDYEIKILETVDFFLGVPSPILFLRPLSVLKQREKVSHNLAKCLIEICLQSYELAGHPAHILASVSYCLSMTLCSRESDISFVWIPLIKFVTGLDVEDIRPVVTTLVKVLRTTNFNQEMPSVFNEHKAIFKVLEKRKAYLDTIGRI